MKDRESANVSTHSDLAGGRETVVLLHGIASAPRIPFSLLTSYF